MKYDSVCRKIRKGNVLENTPVYEKRIVSRLFILSILFICMTLHHE